MLKLILSFLCFSCIFCIVQAQEKFPDSVQSDFDKAVYYNVLAKGQSFIDSSVYFTEKALPFSRGSNDDSLLIATYYLQAYFNYYASKYKPALKKSLILDSILKVKKNDYYLINNKILISQSYIYLNQPAKALEYGNQALDYSINIVDSALIADSYYHLGYLYNTNDMNKQAKKYFIKSLEILDKIQAEEKDKYRIYTGLVRVSENYNEAVYYLDKTYETIKDSKKKYKIAYFYVNKGDILSRWEEGKPESIKASKIGLQISDSINQTQLAKVALLNISRGNIDLQNYESAIEPLNRLLSMDSGNTQTRFLILEALSRAHEGLKNYEKAFEYEKEITQLKDSIYTIKESSTFADFDTKFKTAEKDKEIAQQQLEIAQQKSNRNKWIFGGLGFLLVGFSLFQWRNNQQKRKKLLAEAKYQNEQEINELRTKFLGNIAHEIRTPLTLISGNLNLALENYDNKDKATQNIKTALSNSKKVVEDANEILELLKFEKNKTTIKLNEVNLTQTLKRIYFSFASLAEMKHIKLDFQSTIPENISVKIDVDKVEKILNNLVSNAVKYSPSNATIIFNATQENNILTVKVTDFGQGIHFNETEKIFQRFYQSSQSNAVGGIGIGLSLAKEFAELLNGNLSVESELEKGSTFIFTLPIEAIDKNIAQQNKEALNKKGQKEDKTSFPTDTEILHPEYSDTQNEKKPNILIVEDNPEMCTYIVEILSGKYNCSTAFDGEEALSKIEKQSFDLITSDIMMPKLDGFQLREKLNKNEQLKNIPFILISAKTLEEDKVKGFQLGIDDYVVKPFNKNELIARIDNLLANKKSREQWELQNKDLEPATDSSDKTLLKKIEAEVISNISDESFKIAELASAVGYSQRQLTRILKQYTGMSPVKFILEIRLQKAYKLLQNKSFFTLSEVRYDVGITSSSYFNKKFKERFGINPSELIS